MNYFGQNVPGWVQPMPQPMPQNQSIPQPAPYNQPTMPVPPPQTMQQPQPRVQQPAAVITGFVGRYIDDISEVMPNEVPMDGNIAIFPTKDANAVYLKVWNRAGNLLTVRYVMDQDQSMPSIDQSQSDPMQQVYARLSKLEDAIKTRKPTGSRKESET